MLNSAIIGFTKYGKKRNEIVVIHRLDRHRSGARNNQNYMVRKAASVDAQ